MADYVGTTVNGAGSFPVEVKTAAYTIVAGQDQNKIFTNTGASGEVTLSLPAATVGQKYCFYVNAAQEIRIDPNGTETIGLPSSGVQQAAGAYLTANAVGEYLEIECIIAGTWTPKTYSGTWTAV
jgi:hypothetical protein